MLHLVRDLESQGFDVEMLSRRDAGHWFAEWCQAYLGEVRSATGLYRYRGLHWHAFSYGFVNAVDGAVAVDAYARQTAAAVLVIPEDWSGGCGVRCRGAGLPDLVARREDLYVFPESLAWSMAFTHEQPALGPYFALRTGRE